MTRTLTAIAIALVLAARAAEAADAADLPPDEAAYRAACIRTEPDGDSWATCFDLGNALALSAGTDGFGAGIALRHVIRTGDPTIWWRFEHRITQVTVGFPAFRGTLYEGRYLRHSRDGYLTIPASPPKRIFLPFDVGAEATVMRVTGRTDSDLYTIRAVRAAVIFDLARSRDFRKRLTIGTAVHWDLDALGQNLDVLEHRVSPFTGGQLDGWLESKDGLTRAAAHVEGGAEWSDRSEWGAFLAAEASIERVFMALNDRPLAVYASVGYEDPGRGFTAAIGVRFVVLGSRPWSQSMRIPERTSRSLGP